MTSASDSDLIKTDSRGRVRTPARRREQLLQEFASSGVSARKFAQLAGVHYQTFAGWLKRQKMKLAPLASTPGTKPPPDRVQWLEAIIEKRPSATDSNAQTLVRRNRPAEPYPAAGAAGSCAGSASGAGLDFGRGQPLGVATVRLGAKVSSHPLGVSCQMSLLG